MGRALPTRRAGSPFYVRFAALSAHLDLLATMIELGEFARQQHGTHSWVHFDPEGRWEGAQAVRLASALPLPRLGGEREIDEDVRRWPEHWLAADGLTSDVRTPRGASTTIAELRNGAAAGREVSGTVRATVTRLASTAAASRVLIDDGTDVLDVWCPAAVCVYGPVLRRALELDVVVRPGPAAPVDWRPEQREAQERALDLDLAGAAAARAELHAQAFVSAAESEATAIRPLD